MEIMKAKGIIENINKRIREAYNQPTECPDHKTDTIPWKSTRPQTQEPR